MTLLGQKDGSEHLQMRRTVACPVLRGFVAATGSVTSGRDFWSSWFDLSQIEILCAWRTC